MRNRAQGLGVAVLLLLAAAASYTPQELRLLLGQTLAVSWICGALALMVYFADWERRP